jgi:hypothetical protein
LRVLSKILRERRWMRCQQEMGLGRWAWAR